MQQTCITCGQTFDVTDEDLAYYEEVSPTFNNQRFQIPPPKKCPECRQWQRLTWRNERVLYRRKCAATQKDIITPYSEDKPFTVYDNDYWWGSDWDAKAYGRDIDFNRTFAEQFRELMEATPILARATLNLQNSNFVNEVGYSKNCYLIFEADQNENCMYSNNIFDSRWCIDCLHVVDCELCYESIDCIKCYNCKYTQDCTNCTDSLFLRNCIGCQQCIGCVNQRNKKFCIFNEQHTQEEFEQKKREIMNGSWHSMQAFKQQMDEFFLQFPNKCFRGTQNEESYGDHIRNTQRCQHCFDFFNGQDCKYVFNARNCKKVQDLMCFGDIKGVEFSYSNHSVGDGCRSVFFSDTIYTGCSDIWYSKHCVQNCSNLFGCMSLQHDSYCILNKQYSEDEWQAKAAQLVEHMINTGEWGEWLPTDISPYCYNESYAQIERPLTKEQAGQYGFTWKDNIIELQQIDQKIPADQLPDAIADIPEDILGWAVECPSTGRPFRIIKQEYDYYKEHNVPLPRNHSDERHRLRMERRNPQRLWQRQCQQCGRDVHSSFAPERPEIVYCDDCYQQCVT